MTGIAKKVNIAELYPGDMVPATVPDAYPNKYVIRQANTLPNLVNISSYRVFPG
jgi:hypothetical protein